MEPDSEIETTSFEQDASDALRNVRASLANLIGSIGEKILRPTDLQKALDVDSKLSWQVFNVISESDIMAAAKLVPGDPSLKRLIQAARNRGVSDNLCEGVRHAIAEFNAVVDRHADDREEFDFMASSAASGPAAAAAELGFRRTAFRGESHIWGISIDCAASTTIARLLEDGLTTDEASILNTRGWRRLRLDATTSIVSYRNYGAGGPSASRRIPLDANAAELQGADLRPRFCTQPIPVFRKWLRPDGYTSVDVPSREIGRKSSFDLTLGHIYRKCPVAKGVNGEPIYHSDMRMHTPIRLLISYLIVHRPSFGVIKPSLQVFRSAPNDMNPVVASSVPQVLTREEISYMGVGKPAWRTPDIKGHDEMVQYAFDELGWNPAEFDVYRVRVEYPVLFSVARIHFAVASPVAVGPPQSA
jgi:hypothetical protein